MAHESILVGTSILDSRRCRYLLNSDGSPRSLLTSGPLLDTLHAKRRKVGPFACPAPLGALDGGRTDLRFGYFSILGGYL